MADGGVQEGSYSNGKKEGIWTDGSTQLRYSRGEIVKTPKTPKTPERNDSEGYATAIMSGILSGLQAATPILQNANTAIQLQRQQEAARREEQRQEQRRRQAEQERQYEEYRQAAARQERQQQETARRQAEEAKERERQRQEAERRHAEEQDRKWREAEKLAAKQDCINRISGSRTQCISVGKWTGGATGWRLHNRCDEPLSVWYKFVKGPGGYSLTHVRPYGSKLTHWTSAGKRQLQYHACYAAVGVSRHCEVSSYACNDGEATIVHEGLF